ncbi:MAG: class I SAM-dependent methyltransferase [Candidatus Parcubacteria bacterium]|nr:class I SAM-dependent methyltransferase [Candidatus Parcubacteria bacterium]
MIYKFLERMVTKPESRQINLSTDIEPSETHIFNASLIKTYIQRKKVLDIGCWTGQLEKLILQETKELIGLEPDNDAVRVAKKTIPGVSFFVGTAEKLPFKDNSFDTIIFLDVIEHIPAQTELTCLKEINRVLKPKGILILSTNYKHPVGVLFDPSFWAFGHRHYGKSELKNMLTQTGFHTKRIITSGRFWRIVTFNTSMVAKHIFKIKLDYPKWIKKKVLEDFKPGGVVSIHIIAQKR